MRTGAVNQANITGDNMTDILLAIIVAILLIQWHQREKSFGWYGKLNVIFGKRLRRYIKSKF